MSESTGYDWQATPAGVAALLPTRTKGEFGESGTWDEGTTPTLAQVEEICVWATKRVASKLRITEDNDICEDGPTDLAHEDANLRAAMRVEMTFFANQLRTDQSPYKTLKAEQEEAEKDLLEEFKDKCGASSGGEGTGPLGEEMPRGNFPPARDWRGARL